MRVELSGDERVVVRTRPHARALRGPAWGLLILMAVCGFTQGLLSRLPALGDPWPHSVAVAAPIIWGLFALAAFAWVVRPVWKWMRTRIVITTRRVLVQRSGRVREMPLPLLAGVSAKTGVGAGLDGPGTLILETSGGQAKIPHVPGVVRAASLVRELRSALPWDQSMVPTHPGSPT